MALIWGDLATSAHLSMEHQKPIYPELDLLMRVGFCSIFMFFAKDLIK